MYSKEWLGQLKRTVTRGDYMGCSNLLVTKMSSMTQFLQHNITQFIGENTWDRHLYL